MDTKEKVLLQLLVSVVGGVLVFNITKAQGDYFLFGVDYSLVTTGVFLLVMLFVFSLVPRLFERTVSAPALKRKVTDHLNLDVYPSKLDGGYLDLVIENKVKNKPFATINAAYIDHLGHPTYRSKLSKEDKVVVDKGKVRTARFIKEMGDGTFIIMTHAVHSENPVYGFGKHKFVAILVYGLGEGSQNQYMKCYQMLVNYKKLHDFDIKIKPVDCGKRETKFLIVDR